MKEKKELHINDLLDKKGTGLPLFMHHLTKTNNSKKEALKIAKSKKIDGYLAIKKFYKPISKLIS